MTDLPDYERDHPAAYQWTEKAFELLTEGRLRVAIADRLGVHIAEASGHCPRCDHDVDFSMELDAPLPGGLGGLGGLDQGIIIPPGAAQYATINVVCRCNGEHPGRPEGIRRGCGILFDVEVLRP